MSEAMFTNAIVSLFEVAEVNSIGDPQQAHAIATQLDSRGRQVLSKDDFIEAVRFVLTDVDSSEAVHMINDLVMRMRMTYRRRYLMYDAPANRCAPALLQNVRTVEMYREMFDIFAHGQEYISRHDLRRLANEILPEYPTDAANIVKAAIGEGERDAIGFQEFIMVIQPTTSRRPLSEMIQLATSRIMNWSSDDGDRGYNPTSAVGGGGTPHKGTARNADDGSNTAFGSPMLTSSLQPWRESEDLLAQNAVGGGGGGGGNRSRATTPPPSGKNAVGQRPRHGGGTTSSSTVMSSPTGAGTLHHELQQAKQHHEAAEAIFQNVLTGNQRVNLATITKLSDVGATMKMPSLLERDLAQMKLENESLKHQVAQLQMSNLRLGSGRSGGSPRRNGGGAAGGIGALNQDAMAHIAELEHELRSARAQLAVRTEAHQLIALLNKSNTTEEGLRQYYHDERTLISKQEYLRSVSSTLHEGDGTSPISLVLSQYDLIVCGYQALFRDLKRRYDAGGGGGRFRGAAVGGGRPRHYDNSSAASTIVPKNVPVTYSVPSRGTSPSRTLAAPLRWQELDAEVSTDMKGTGTLRDPLLTLEERNQLRAKLASQMRGAARHYTPKKKQQNPYGATAQEYAASSIHGGGGGAYDHDESPANHDEHAQLQQWLMPGAATQLASHDAVSRLHSLQHQAVKHRRL
ncbi:Hypothetical protein, putative [Bodo saltans]|uniref:EF-hand domain-containing protein n=1 Tax=Bodo saltans TaxID=75058 RepID=A0A0S4JMU0_BODSA|nr:Hypothetical protein, putative [Bodo saltans]|eukprot:CUG89826.1 Hypothetical protein, putative [Bodo saltans]